MLQQRVLARRAVNHYASAFLSEQHMILCDQSDRPQAPSIPVSLDPDGNMVEQVLYAQVLRAAQVSVGLGLQLPGCQALPSGSTLTLE